jgi:para-aminobenzoate synthetase component 1
MQVRQDMLVTTGSRAEAVFHPFAHEEGAMWLDTSLVVPDRGMRSVMARSPKMVVAFDGGLIGGNAESRVYSRPGSIHDYLKMLQRLWAEPELVSVGYLTYEAMIRLLGLEPVATLPSVPEAVFCFYDSALLFEDAESEPAIAGLGGTDLGDWKHPGGLERASRPGQPCLAALATMRPEDYLQKVEKVRKHIYEGDIYQANLTTRFDVESAVSAWEVYRYLREVNPAPFGAYLNFGSFQVISCSPERMFALEPDGRVTTAPIKGTVATGLDEREQAINVRRLEGSEKDRAELLMIVDLLRNDLGRVAQIGTVSVDRLFRCERYASVTHLVADISARLAEGRSLVELLTALSPGGSITGAPKRRAVEILMELETVPRGLYTGCIGWVYGGRAEFNIAIRTMLHVHGMYHIHAGGGIVADSDAECERREVLLKAEPLFAALGVRPEQLGW